MPIISFLGFFMNNLTAQFIESFFSLGQESLLKDHFVEEVAMIEQLSSLKLSANDEYAFHNFIFKEIPKLQNIIHTANNNEVLQKMKISKTETIEDSISSQILLVQQNFQALFFQVFEDEKIRIMANQNLLEQKSHNFKTSNGTAPTLKTETEEETFAKPIVIPTAKTLLEIGNKILSENNGHWQNNFQRKSQTILNGNRDNIPKNQATSSPSRNESLDDKKKVLITIGFIVIPLIVLIISLF